jgi:hypothetical protein
MEGVHVERHVVDLAVVIGQRRVDERVHRHVLLDEGPDIVVGGMENVRPIVVKDDVILDMGCDVPAGMVPAFDDEHFLARIGEEPGHRGARKAASDDKIIKFHADIIPQFRA